MPLNKPCDCCEQLFKDPANLDAMIAEGYKWTRNLSSVLSSAAHGCSFCHLLSRTFELDKLAKPKSTAPVYLPVQPVEVFAEMPITFSICWLEGYTSALTMARFGMLSITAEDVNDGRNLQHWGMSGALSIGPKTEIFRVMAPEGMCTEMVNILTLLTSHTTGDAATNMVQNTLSHSLPTSKPESVNQSPG
jgi:hypothetical protein